MASVTLQVGGMKGSECQQKVAQALQRTPGVNRAMVNLREGSATVYFDATETTVPSLKDAIRGVGYQVE